MRPVRCFLILSLFSFCLLPAGLAQTQDTSIETDRKVVRQVTPVYPEMARKMNLSGTVKVVAIISPDGKVKNVQAMGGNPLLIQAAEGAISQWKFAPAVAESKETIELHFHP